MATVGPALTIPFTVGAGATVGGGNHPELQLFRAANDARETPEWVAVENPKIRNYKIDRGRPSERDKVDAATLTLTIDNRDRSFDWYFDNNSAGLKPGNRIWLRALFSGLTEDRFVGNVSSYKQRWPAGGKDAETVIVAKDDFALLSRGKLPVLDPPSAKDYADVVMFDQPAAYWRFDSSDWGKAEVGGQDLIDDVGHGFSRGTATPILGDDGSYIQDIDALAWANPGSPLNPNGLDTLTLEMWYRTAGTPGSTQGVAFGPSQGGTFTYGFQLTTSRTMQFFVYDSAAVLDVAESPVLEVNRWYHMVGELDTGGIVRIYVDGAQNTGGTMTGAFVNVTSSTAVFKATVNASPVQSVDELAFYRYPLPVARIQAHYNAGSARGYPRVQNTQDRVESILDDAGSLAVRNIPVAPSERLMLGAMKHGQPPIDELREAERAELPDGLMFFSRSGTFTFLHNEHRTVSPWDTVQATFGDAGGSEHAYTMLETDYTDSFVVNRWDAQREPDARGAGLLQTASDPTSIDVYDERASQVTALQLYDEADVLAIVTALVAKTKDAQDHIPAISVNTNDPDRCAALLALEIGDRVRVLWTPPAGGSRIDQTSFIQHISESGDRRDGGVLRFDLGISPL